MDVPVIFVAPHRRMAELARQVISSLGLRLPVETASDFEAAAAVRRYRGVRVVISRGGTAKALRGLNSVTVVDIGASFYDVFMAVQQLLDRGCRHIGIVGQDNIIGLEHARISHQGSAFDFFPCRSAEEIPERVREAAAGGADGIAGCRVAVEYAGKLQLPAAYIEADFFTLKKAVLEALGIESSLRSLDLSLGRMEALLNNIEEAVVIFDDGCSPLYFNERAEKLLEGTPKSGWYELLGPAAAPPGRETPALRVIGGHRVLLRRLQIHSGGTCSGMVVMQESSLIEESARSIRMSAYEKGLYARASFRDILYRSAVMAGVAELAQKYAASGSTVMIFGETGTGKEGFAQSIHNASPRRAGPFVSVNCASIPEGLAAAELFGYAGGAFTGARSGGRKGLFELANGGTIFLDEISEIPPELQSQFLRVLEEREVRRLGDDRVVPLDIRIICASNRQILPLCEQGKFRFDLYYRLNVLRLSIPPLRERGEDILYLFRHFLASFLKISPEEPELEDGVAQLLQSYRWPGNVRELRNVAEALSFYGPCVRCSTLREQLCPAGGTQRGTVMLEIPAGASLREVEQAYLRQLLAGHTLREAVQLSGLSRTTLWRRLKAGGAG